MLVGYPDIDMHHARGSTTRAEPLRLYRFSGIHKAAVGLTVGVLLMALVVLLGGWLLGVEALIRIHPSYAAMVPSTALSFVLLSGAVFWWLDQAPTSTAPVLGIRLIAVIVGLVAALDLLVISTETASGIDELVWRGVVRTQPSSMSPATALAFLLGTASLVALTHHGRMAESVAVVCATAGLLLASVASVGYAFDARSLYAVSIFTAMALHTTLGFIALFVALLMVRVDVGWMAVLLGDGRGSAGARRLLPMVLMAPFFLGLLTLVATDAGFLDPNFGLSLLAILTIALLTLVVLRNARIENQSERRLVAAMEDLRAALGDRDVLLREVYHRVKNNLQQINALISIESARLKDPEAKLAFRSTAARIQTLGTIHRLLIAAPLPCQLDTKRFASDLCINLSASFGLASRGIELTADAAEERVEIDRAISIGLLLNELVTNAVKHAFEGRDHGRIHVTYATAETGHTWLTVSDDGIGLPEAAKTVFPGTGAGARIINSLLRQMDASFVIEADRGTRITISIPPEAAEDVCA